MRPLDRHLSLCRKLFRRSVKLPPDPGTLELNTPSLVGVSGLTSGSGGCRAPPLTLAFTGDVPPQEWPSGGKEAGPGARGLLVFARAVAGGSGMSTGAVTGCGTITGCPPRCRGVNGRARSGLPRPNFDKVLFVISWTVSTTRAGLGMLTFIRRRCISDTVPMLGGDGRAGGSFPSSRSSSTMMSAHVGLQTWDAWASHQRTS